MNNLILMSDGGVLAVGSSISSGSSSDSMFNSGLGNNDIFITRFSKDGNRVWLKHYQKQVNDGNTVIPKKIIRLKDNNFVLVLTQYNHMRKEHIRLIKFDLYQNILLDKEIFTTYPSEINDIKEYSDGKFIAVGYVKDTYNTDGLAMIHKRLTCGSQNSTVMLLWLRSQAV
jgi:hypothetical protein